MHNSIKNYPCFVGGIIFSLNYVREACVCAHVREVFTTCVCRLEWSYLSTVESSSLLYMHFCKFNFSSRKRRAPAHYLAAFLFLLLLQKGLLLSILLVFNYTQLLCNPFFLVIFSVCETKNVKLLFIKI